MMPKDRSASRPRGNKPVRSGGGYESLKTKSIRESTREKPATHKISEEAAAQLGAQVGFRGAPTLYQGQGFQPVPMGNTRTVDPKPGPGSGRQVLRSGAQGLHGPVSQGVKDWAPDVSATGTRGVDILSQYGKERSGR